MSKIAASSARKFDLVLYGATGFTGRLVARYLRTHPQTEGLRWALAGRNAEKLEQVRQEIAPLSERALPELVLAASDDAAALLKLAGSTRVVLSTAGPFILHGLELVRACVEKGCDYVDITGEPSFVASTIEVHHHKAQLAGLRIISCCGFDSVPHDLGAQFTLEQLPKNEAIAIEGFVSASGSVSGGTWQSALLGMSTPADQSNDRPAWREPGTSERTVKGLRGRVRFEPTLKKWVAPLPTIDPRIVLRSARLSADYGSDFRYGHYLAVKHLPQLVGLGLGVGAVAALAQFGPSRRLLQSMKSSGEGPSEEQRAKGHFSVHFLGKSQSAAVHTKVSGGDAGYGDTSKMVSEAALTLLFDRERLPDVKGVVTPAAALGPLLRERLVATGMRFEVVGG